LIIAAAALGGRMPASSRARARRVHGVAVEKRDVLLEARRVEELEAAMIPGA
jgi:hypothetical protein